MPRGRRFNENTSSQLCFFSGDPVLYPTIRRRLHTRTNPVQGLPALDRRGMKRISHSGCSNYSDNFPLQDEEKRYPLPSDPQLKRTNPFTEVMRRLFTANRPSDCPGPPLGVLACFPSSRFPYPTEKSPAASRASCTVTGVLHLDAIV